MEQVQWKATVVLKWLEHLTYRERVRELEAVQPQEENVWVAFIIVYKYLMGVKKEPDTPQWCPVKEAAVRTHQNAFEGEKKTYSESC